MNQEKLEESFKILEQILKAQMILNDENNKRIRELENKVNELWISRSSNSNDLD
jgi:hypothetical protein